MCICGYLVSVFVLVFLYVVLFDYFVFGGRVVLIFYNGLVVWLWFGLVIYCKVKKWFVYGDFDVLYLYELNVLSLLMLVLNIVEGLIVVIFYILIIKLLMLMVF